MLCFDCQVDLGKRNVAVGRFRSHARAGAVSISVRLPAFMARISFRPRAKYRAERLIEASSQNPSILEKAGVTLTGRLDFVGFTVSPYWKLR